MAKKRRKTADIPRELERAGELCLAFANTAAPRIDERYLTSPPPKDPIAHYTALLDWTRRMAAVNALEAERLIRAATEHPDEAADVLAQSLELRSTLVRIATALAFNRPAASADLEALNDAIPAARAARRLVVKGDGYAWVWKDDAQALDRILWPLVESATVLLTSENRKRVRQCADPKCTRVFIDRSHHRKWCDSNTCGNRLKGRRYHGWRAEIEHDMRDDPLGIKAKLRSLKDPSSQ